MGLLIGCDFKVKQNLVYLFLNESQNVQQCTKNVNTSPLQSFVSRTDSPIIIASFIRKRLFHLRFRTKFYRTKYERMRYIDQDRNTYTI